jgi:hypothetical protein
VLARRGGRDPRPVVGVEAHAGRAGERDPPDEPAGREVEHRHLAAGLHLDCARVGHDEVDRRARQLELGALRRGGHVHGLDPPPACREHARPVAGGGERERRAAGEDAPGPDAGPEVDEADGPPGGHVAAPAVRRGRHGTRLPGQRERAHGAVAGRVEQRDARRVRGDQHDPRLSGGGGEEQEEEAGQQRAHGALEHM